MTRAVWVARGRECMVRLNVSQVLVLPHFQGRGHGKQVGSRTNWQAALAFALVSRLPVHYSV